MRNISDVIENFLKNIIELSDNSEIEVQRSALAEQFQCVPSQINYVISTRFSVEKGFLVESKRGGGGYIRIKKIEIGSNHNFYQILYSLVGDEISQSTATDILERLKSEGFLSVMDFNLIKAIIAREVINLPLPIRDQVRSNIMKAMLRIIFSNNEEGDE